MTAPATPEKWAEEHVEEYHGGLLTIDGDSGSPLYLDRAHARALRDRLTELLGDDADPDARFAPTGLLPPEEDATPTVIVSASECNRAYVDAIHNAIAET